MGDAKLTSRQLAEVLDRIDEIEKHTRALRQQLIESMAKRRRERLSGRPLRARPTSR